MSLTVTISTIIIFVMSFSLSTVITASYRSRRTSSLLMWSAGLWIFSLAVLLEVLFSVGIYSQLLIKSYLVLVSLLVEMLAMGSVLLLRNKKLTAGYTAYAFLSTVFLVYIMASAGSLGNLLSNGVVFGVIPVMVAVGSAMISGPAAVLLILISAVSYRKRKDPKLLSIIAGVVIVSIAGSLYIAAFPAFLYYSEFIGVLLLWLGFVDFRNIMSNWRLVKKNVVN